MSSSYDGDIDEDDNSSEDDDSLLGAFKEVGEEFKDVGIELADAFGIKLKKKKKKEKNAGNQNNRIPTTVASRPEIKCPSCGSMIGAGSQFCSSYGYSLAAKPVSRPIPQENICPSCGKRLDSTLQFCTECGTPIASVREEDSIRDNSLAKETAKEGLSLDKQIELLQKLKSLVDAGIITQEKFEEKKKEIF